MPNLVVVAIPSENDYVWKISSEKIPHMTLLFLGEMPVENFMDIAGFVDHASQRSLKRFGMEVDKRGVLGPDKADVLFFDKSKWSGYEDVAAYRSFLLQDSNIRAAYESVEQYPVWLPHLTLGFPETPAKPDNRDYPGISYVSFDKIALWFNDYDGFEYPLKSEWDMMEVAMGASTIDRGFVATIGLLHYGVKGMKWGVRKSNVPRPVNNFTKKQQLAIVGTGGFAFLNKGVRDAYTKNQKGAKVYRTAKKQEKAGRTADKKAAKLDKHDTQFREKVTSNKQYQEELKVYAHNAALNITQQRLTTINDKPVYQKAGDNGTLANDNHPITKKYHKEIGEAYVKSMNEQLSTLNTPSGKLGAKVVLDNPDFSEGLTLKAFTLRVVEKDVKHVDDLGVLKIRLVTDDKGFVVGIEVIEDSMTQTALFIDDILHYGVKGMKWGVRKDRTSRVQVTQKGKKLKAKGGFNRKASSDAIKTKTTSQVLKKSGIHALTNEDLQAYNTRLNLEANAKRLNYQNKPAAQRFVATLVGKNVKTSITTVADEAVAKKVKKFMIKTAIAAAV